MICLKLQEHFFLVYFSKNSWGSTIKKTIKGGGTHLRELMPLPMSNNKISDI